VSILYPVAATAEAALNAPRGRAARQTDAQRLANEPVSFVREFTGPTFQDESEARAAWAARVDQRGTSLASEDRYCDLRPVIQRSRIPFAPAHTVWRLSVAYWRVGAPEAPPVPQSQARKARRQKGGPAPDAPTLEAMANQPLLPVRPQQPLDIGLFETRLPEAPHIVIPDE
jgi:hypothetical protein